MVTKKKNNYSKYSKYIMNTHKSPKDIRDFNLKSYIIQEDKIPISHIIKHNLPIRNQKSIGSCASCTAVRAVEIQMLTKKRWFLEGSELFHYYMVRKYVNKSHPKDNGQTMRDSCKAIQKYGSSLEVLCPYDVKQFNTSPSKVSRWLGFLTKAKSYYKCKTLKDIKRSISNNIPVVCGVRVDTNYYKLLNKGISVWKIGGKVRGGHAQICTSYDDKTQMLTIENSWGTRFGNNGKYQISYKDFQKVSFDWYSIIL